MKIVQRAIPSEFLKIDDGVTDDYEFVNVHDQQQLRKNHNALLAEGMMTNIFSHTIGIDYNELYDFVLHGIYGGYGTELVDTIFEVPVLIPHHVRELKFVCYGAASRAAADVFLYPHLSVAGRFNRELHDDTKITITGTSAAWYSTTIPVPYSETTQTTARLCVFQLFADAEIGSEVVTTPGKSVVAVTQLATTLGWNSANMRIEVNDADLPSGTLPGNLLYFHSQTIEPRRVQTTSTASGSTTYLQVDRAWTKNPTTSMAWRMWESSYPKLGYIGLYEKNITTFDDEWGNI